MGEREFRGIWFPAEIWLDKRLNALDKIVLLEINSLDKTEEGCWATNEYIADFCQCSAWKISTAIQKLLDLGYIEIISFDGRHRHIRSKFGFFTMQPCDFPKAAFGISHAISNKENTKRDSIVYSDDFLKFWKVYPKKDNKIAAFKAWKALKPDAALVDAIVADITNRRRTTWKDKDVQYIPNGSTYLNQRRWEDEHSTGVVSEINDPDRPWWKDKPWWEWPLEEQERAQRELEEREERERNKG